MTAAGQRAGFHRFGLRGDDHSVGHDVSVPAFDVGGKDEMATLARSFSRVRRRVEKATGMLDN